MNKRFRFFIIIILLATVLGISGIVAFYHVPTTTLTYQESDEILANPGRGVYVQFDSADLEGLNELEAQGITLVLLAYDIQDFVDQDLSETKLNELSHAFDLIRGYGLKVIFRAAYGFTGNAEFGDPSSIDRILNHLNQISPILQENADLLLTVQAGFLGPWGEWHHSNLGEDQGKPTSAVINTLLAALCDAVPAPISIAVRRPGFIRLIDPTKVDLSRIAFHNDALLSSDSDMSSYDLENFTREEELTFIHDRPYSVANGGEMPVISPYTDPSIAALELAQLKLTYLNHEYNKEVIVSWATTDYDGEPFIDFIKRKMGYRFSLSKAVLPVSFRKNQNVTLKLDLTNTGFSALTIPYRVELVIRDSQGILEVLPFDEVNLMELGSDETKTLRLAIKLSDEPSSISLGLRLAESATTQIHDERALIQLANQDLTGKDRITVFATYDWDGQQKFVLRQP